MAVAVLSERWEERTDMLAGPKAELRPYGQLTPWNNLCEKKYRLLDDFLAAVRELNYLHTPADTSCHPWRS
ncbi:MAG: hypothetical protein WDO73_12330 [Ignavibacteriota bacterium]